MPVKAPIVDGEVVLEPTNTLHGKITGTVELPDQILSGRLTVREAKGGVPNGPHEFASVTYISGTKDDPVTSRQFLSVHIGPNTMVPQAYPYTGSVWSLYQGYVVTLG